MFLGNILANGNQFTGDIISAPSNDLLGSIGLYINRISFSGLTSFTSQPHLFLCIFLSKTTSFSILLSYEYQKRYRYGVREAIEWRVKKKISFPVFFPLSEIIIPFWAGAGAGMDGIEM